MPQGRRKVPFSTKLKKTQLQEKRERKRENFTGDGHSSSSTIVHLSEESNPNSNRNLLNSYVVQKVNEQPLRDTGLSTNRYSLFFQKDSAVDIKKRKEDARKDIRILPENALEVSYEEVYIPGSELDIPKRPAWDYTLSKQKLEALEERYFREYLDNIEKKFARESLSYSELNIETWRQLWRVVEMSDILLMIADIRHPVLHFSPALYEEVTHNLKKDVIFVLNKIDLVPAPLVLAWKHYFQQHFPKLHIICFSAFGGSKIKPNKKGKRKGKLKMAAEGAKELVKMCQNIIQGAVDLSSWEQKIEDELAETDCKIDEDDDDEDNDPLSTAKIDIEKADATHYSAERYLDGTLTLGFVGHPNVGKSSLLNAIMGRKVVSVSRTPGHTKHFQTIFLTNNVRLCDCPGLVFPSLVPKPLQVLSGCFPIAQVQEPYSVIAFIGERLRIQDILKLEHPDEDKVRRGHGWSAFDICEGWAFKRGFLTAKAGRPDTHRAANNMLRMALDGRTLCLNFYPPGYTSSKKNWEHHAQCDEICRLQGFWVEEKDIGVLTQSESESSSGEEESDVNPIAVNKFAVLCEEG